MSEKGMCLSYLLGMEKARKSAKVTAWVTDWVRDIVIEL
jgi:hypothetical protein